MQRVPRSLPWFTFLFTAILLSASAVLVLPSRAAADGCQTPITVANTDDSGSGSLRQAIADLCPGGVIDFAPALTASGPATVTLTSGELVIDKDMLIAGPVADLLAVSGNNASRVFNVSSGVSASIVGLTIRDGETNGGGVASFGGGILNSGVLTVTDSNLISNSSSGSGGGIANYFGSLHVSNSAFIGNSANFGGGIDNSGALTVTNSTFNGNAVSDSGGGIYNFLHSVLTVTNSTLAGNTASNAGGGIFQHTEATLAMTNNILAGNMASDSGSGNCGIAAGSTATDRGGNVEDGASCGFNSANGSLNNTDPLLSALTPSYHTWVLPLLPGSPAIDAGVLLDCPQEDQRRLYRFAGTSCDSGAFETHGFTLAVMNGSPQTTTLYSAFAEPLKVLVSSWYDEPAGPGGIVIFTPPIEGPGLNVTEPFTVSTDVNGVAASGVITANAVAGSYSVTPTVRGEGYAPAAFNGSPLPAVFDLTNERIEPSISLSSSSNPSVFTEMVALSVGVSTDVAGANTPTGVVTFTIDGNFWGAETLDAWGEASLYDSSLSVGSHSVVAEYSGDASFTGASDTLTQVVKKLPTTTELEINPNQVFYDDQVSFIVAVAADAPQPNALRRPSGPSGALTITDTTGVIDLSGSVVDGAATISGGTIPAGSYNVIATYWGDDNIAGSTSQPATLVVEKHATVTTLASNSNPVFVDAPLCFTGVVGEQQLDFVRSLGMAGPTGAVVIADNSGAINLSGSLDGGSVQLCAPQLAAGTYTVTATYLGDDGYATSVSTQFIQVVERHATGTLLELTPSQVYVGDTFQLQATVSNMDPAALINGGPAGKVEFLADGNLLGSATLSNGQATLNAPANGAGVFQMTARYLGNNAYTPSTSDPAQLTVVKRPTTTTLTAAPNPSTQREAVLFTATVTEQQQGLAAAAVQPKPTGVVIFTAGGNEFGSAALVEGVATLRYAELPVGNATITAHYEGDSMFSGSQSAAHQQTVVLMPLAANDAAGAQEQPISINVTANDLDPAGGGLTVISVSAPAHGVATVAPDSGSVIYTPKAGYSGTDTFTYVIEDANGNQDDALVVVVNTLAVEGEGKPQVQPTNPNVESTAVFTAPAATLTVQMPSGFFTDTLAPKDVLFISFTPVLTPTEETNHPPANLKFGNAEFVLQVYLNDQLLTGRSFAVPLEVVINYDPAVLGNLKPETLGLWYWDGAAWSTDGVTILSHDVANHTLTVSMTHFSLYAFFAAAPTNEDPSDEPASLYKVFLPTVNK